MNETVSLLLSVLTGSVAGVALGVMFFGGLWLTTQRLVTSPHPALLALLSLVGRMILLALGMLLVARLGAIPLIVAACGIVAARQLFIHRIQVGSTGVS